MKKYIILLICLIVLGIVTGGYFIYKSQWFYENILNSRVCGTGHSMEPTIKDGQCYLLHNQKPKVGDIIAVLEYKRGKNPLKRLTKIDENNCWWLEGDNKPVSLDSRSYGWICPQDRRFDGVVVKIIPMK